MQTEVFKREEFLKCDKKLPVIVGEDKNSKLIIEDLREINDLLVLGQTGTPRVPFIHNLITSLFLKCKPEDVKILLIDFIAVELGFLSKIPHAKFTLQNFEVDGVIWSYDKCLYALDRLAKETIYRYHKIKEAGAQNIEEYNKLAKEKMPYIVCVVESAHQVKEEDIYSVQGFIEQITSFAKESGVCLVYTTRYTSEIITKDISQCLTSKIIFKLRDDCLFKKEYVIENDEYRKHWFIRKNKPDEKLEMPFISDDEIAYYLRK